jgi:hypothetical protein
MIAAIVMKIRNLFFRLFDLLLGKTAFFVVLLGWFLVITGILFLVQPQRARQKLLGMGFGQVKFYLLLLAVFLGTALFSFGFNRPGIFPKIGALLGIAALVRGYFILKKKVLSRITEWFSRIPLKTLKVFAGIQIAIGACMLLFLRRIFW